MIFPRELLAAFPVFDSQRNSDLRSFFASVYYVRNENFLESEMADVFDSDSDSVGSDFEWETVNWMEYLVDKMGSRRLT